MSDPHPLCCEACYDSGWTVGRRWAEVWSRAARKWKTEADRLEQVQREAVEELQLARAEIEAAKEGTLALANLAAQEVNRLRIALRESQGLVAAWETRCAEDEAEHAQRETTLRERAEVAEDNAERFRRRIHDLTDERAALTSKADRLQGEAGELRAQAHAWQARLALDRAEHDGAIRVARAWSRRWKRAAWEFWRARNFLLGGDRRHVKALYELLKKAEADA